MIGSLTFEVATSDVKSRSVLDPFIQTTWQFISDGRVHAHISSFCIGFDEQAAGMTRGATAT
jgi:hypothetical protein